MIGQVAQAIFPSTTSLTWRAPPVPLGRKQFYGQVLSMGQSWGRSFHTLNSQTAGNTFKVPAAEQREGIIIHLLLLPLCMRPPWTLQQWLCCCCRWMLGEGMIQVWRPAACHVGQVMVAPGAQVTDSRNVHWPWCSNIKWDGSWGTLCPCVDISTHMMIWNCWAVSLLSEWLQHGTTDMARGQEHGSYLQCCSSVAVRPWPWRHGHSTVPIFLASSFC